MEGSEEEEKKKKKRGPRGQEDDQPMSASPIRKYRNDFAWMIKKTMTINHSMFASLKPFYVNIFSVNAFFSAEFGLEKFPNLS